MTYNPEVTRSKLVEGILHLFLFIYGHMSNPVTCHIRSHVKFIRRHIVVTCHTSGATLWSHVKYIRRSLWSHVTYIRRSSGGHMSNPSGAHSPVTCHIHPAVTCQIHPALIVVTCHIHPVVTCQIHPALIVVTCHIHPAVTLPILTNSLFNKKSFFIRLHTVTSSHT
jgi:hypothetical protein